MLPTIPDVGGKRKQELGHPRFPSIRHGRHAQVRKAFKDNSLVAFRYESTVPAAPPIPLPPSRKLPKASRPVSSACNAVIVNPPPIPPTEQHPAFRIKDDDGKRDSGSGLARTASSTTIRDDFSVEDNPILHKIDQAQAEIERCIIDTKNLPRVPSSISAASTSSDPVVSPVLQAPTMPTRVTDPGSKLLSVPDRWISKSPSLRFPKSPNLPKKFWKSTETEESRPAAGATHSSALLGAARHNSRRSPNPKSRDSEQRTGLGSTTRIVVRALKLSTSISQDAADSQDFSPITTSIPTDTLVDKDFLTQLSFSKHGSVMLSGKKAVYMSDRTIEPCEKQNMSASNANSTCVSTAPATTRPSMSAESSPSAVTKDIPSIRVMSFDIERDANKVRALYTSGDTEILQDGDTCSLDDRLEAFLPEALGEQALETDSHTCPPSERPTSFCGTESSVTSSVCRGRGHRPDSLVRKTHELAGGIEDWEDLEGAEVDRYGFIRLRRPPTGSIAHSPPADSLSPNHVGRRHLLKRELSLSFSRRPNRKISVRSLHSQKSEKFSISSPRSVRSSMCIITNRLPHNSHRRLMDEAGEMLVFSPGVPDMQDDEESRKLEDALRDKEVERSEKWRKMAKVIKKGSEGQGMEFEFDTTNPRLIDRTWKGIPDRWRATAWYSFLATSAKARPGSPSEDDIIADYNRLQSVPSPDDIQIDLDVPRTISGHIMFRRRYRGGQRLLFRVLHALSLYFPAVGYVQGMASLAATLLCYYEEERCFVMLIRMWQLRGIYEIYQPGFDGLMNALQVLERTWLADDGIAQKLHELCINPTAYATRWYLTLFNLSVPFPAQLRIWDVFMLLGDSPVETPSSSRHSNEKASTVENGNEFDILHAASTALMHALQDVLLDSDFETAMKTLTSSVRVKDPDLLLKVTRAAYKQHHGKRRV